MNFEYHNSYPHKELEEMISQFVKYLKGKIILYHITITFQSNMKQQEGINALNALLNLVNKEFFNRKRNECLDGYAFKETKEDKSFHFHILIFDHKAFYANRNINKNFESEFRKAANRIKESYYTKKGKNVTYHPIHPEMGIEFQHYYPGFLEEYDTKESRKCYNFDFMSPLSEYGVSYTDLPKDRPARDIKHKLR